MVTPELNDAHIHVWKVGQLCTTSLDLRGTTDLGELYRRVAEQAATLKAGEWLIGRGWNEALMDGEGPTRSGLDDAAPSNPVLLTRTCAHIHAVNTAALTAARIGPVTSAPGGRRAGLRGGTAIRDRLRPADPGHARAGRRAIRALGAGGAELPGLAGPEQRDRPRRRSAAVRRLPGAGTARQAANSGQPPVHPPPGRRRGDLSVAGNVRLRPAALRQRQVLHRRRPEQGHGSSGGELPQHASTHMRVSRSRPSATCCHIWRAACWHSPRRSTT